MVSRSASADLRWWTLLGVLATGAILWGEAVNWRSSHHLVGTSDAGSEAVVVLGYRDRGSVRANAVNRWRVRAALRSIDPSATTTLLVLCGGTKGGPTSEAALMASYAKELGFCGQVVLEPCSRSTWENIENAIPLVSSLDRIKIVSHPLHAEKGRLYLHQQRPDLASRLAGGCEYRFGEWALLKPPFAAYGLWDLARTRRSLHTLLSRP